MAEFSICDSDGMANNAGNNNLSLKKMFAKFLPYDIKEILLPKYLNSAPKSLGSS